MEVVKEVLGEKFRYFRSQITSESSYRKIHEILITILDTAEGLKPEEALNFLNEQLPRAYVIIEYQNVRGQINKDLRRILTNMIDDLSLSNANDIRKLIRNARLLLDSLAVIAKSSR
ncbi:hypothetical protein B9Q04_03745 [Candidatus Marsarchaeota G2 archaeon BE_D]|uniref:Uncharacterized protein n=1 Tax=Candidatus Marsarchaeota G2 archaeon BE_D TaxID=1978158 RepID=A0A2R6CD18_9ARCH|nr:MAG: hypothetical protein B9Q04_03745 [Candidatus Marsarchaeota G2 archaeon BE_D]